MPGTPPARELVVADQILGEAPQIVMARAIGCDDLERAEYLFIPADRQPAHGDQPNVRVPQPGLGQAALEAEPLRPGEATETGEKTRVLQAGEKLQLAKLHRLEAARGREQGPELEEVLRRHGLKDLDLLD